jgi:hypothetical protein
MNNENEDLTFNLYTYLLVPYTICLISARVLSDIKPWVSISPCFHSTLCSSLSTEHLLPLAWPRYHITFLACTLTSGYQSSGDYFLILNSALKGTFTPTIPQFVFSSLPFEHTKILDPSCYYISLKFWTPPLYLTTSFGIQIPYQSGPII